jgi:hypothetical protein
MRYRYLRSLLRTALAVGLITSGQQHLKAVGLGSLNQPHSGVCFVHDLEWEPFAGSNWKLEDECSLGNSSNTPAHLEEVINTEPGFAPGPCVVLGIPCESMFDANCPVAKSIGFCDRDR